jgi:hypothetical protein
LGWIILTKIIRFKIKLMMIKWDNSIIYLKIWYKYKAKFLKMFMRNKFKTRPLQFKNSKLTALNKTIMLMRELIIEISIIEFCMCLISKFMKCWLNLVKQLYFLELLKIIKVFLIKILNMYIISMLFSNNFCWKRKEWDSKKSWKFLKR